MPLTTDNSIRPHLPRGAVFQNPYPRPKRPYCTFGFVSADRPRPGADDVTVQLNGLLREHQTAADVHAPVLVRREHDGREGPGSVLRRRVPQADQVRCRWPEPRHLLHPPRRAGRLHAPVLGRRTRQPFGGGRQLRVVHRQHRPVFRRR